MEASAVGELINWSQQNLPRSPITFPRPVSDCGAVQTVNTHSVGSGYVANCYPSSSSDVCWSSALPNTTTGSSFAKSLACNYPRDSSCVEGASTSANGAWDSCKETSGLIQQNVVSMSEHSTYNMASVSNSQTLFMNCNQGNSYFTNASAAPSQAQDEINSYYEYQQIGGPSNPITYQSVPAPEVMAGTAVTCEKEIQSRIRDELNSFDLTVQELSNGTGGGGVQTGGSVAGTRGRGRGAGGSKFTTEQLNRLESVFGDQTYPSTTMKTKLCEELGMTLPQMHRWFEQRRKKERNKGKILIAPGREGHERSGEQMSPSSTGPQTGGTTMSKTSKKKSSTANAEAAAAAAHAKTEWSSPNSCSSQPITNASAINNENQVFVDCMTVPNCLPASSAIYGSPQCVIPVSASANYYCEQPQVDRYRSVGANVNDITTFDNPNSNLPPGYVEPSVGFNGSAPYQCAPVNYVGGNMADGYTNQQYVNQQSLTTPYPASFKGIAADPYQTAYNSTSQGPYGYSMPVVGSVVQNFPQRGEEISYGQPSQALPHSFQQFPGNIYSSPSVYGANGYEQTSYSNSQAFKASPPSNRSLTVAAPIDNRFQDSTLDGVGNLVYHNAAAAVKAEINSNNYTIKIDGGEINNVCHYDSQPVIKEKHEGTNQNRKGEGKTGKANDRKAKNEFGYSKTEKMIEREALTSGQFGGRLKTSSVGGVSSSHMSGPVYGGVGPIHLAEKRKAEGRTYNSTPYMLPTAAGQNVVGMAPPPQSANITSNISSLNNINGGLSSPPSNSLYNVESSDDRPTYLEL